MELSMTRIPIQTRFPRLWLAAQRLIGGTKDKSALALRHYSSQRRILEVGCSVGNLSDAYRGIEGISYTGVDVDHSAIAVARIRFSTRSNFRFETVPVRELSKRGEQFDYVVVAGVLHHVSDKTAIDIISSSWNVTAPGGVMITSEPEALRPTDNAIFKLFYKLEEGKFLRDRQRLAELFTTAGIPISGIEDHLVSPGIVSWPAVARFNLVRADRSREL
jgi:2-polyprenyl-3-methyl-5-hydroxy-6-metoxy-1,4-benzoquinol methylase